MAFQPPYGWKWKLVHEPKEWDIVQRILRWYEHGDMNPNAIAEELNDTGVPCRLAEYWSRQLVVKILEREL
jgi:hypothetical protein